MAGVAVYHSTVPANSEGVIWGAPLHYKRDGSKRAVIWCHGRNGSELEAQDASAGFMWGAAFRAITNAGYPCVAPNAGGATTWGNDTAIAAVGQAVSFAQGAPVNGKAGKVFIGGTSMGFVAAANWARQNKSSVAGLIGCVYLPALNWAETTLTGDSAEILTAYGGSTPFTAGLATHDPASYGPTDLAGIPMLLIASSDDNGGGLAPPGGYPIQQAWAQTMAAVSKVTFVTQTGGHSLQNLNPAPFKPFLDANA